MLWSSTGIYLAVSYGRSTLMLRLLMDRWNLRMCDLIILEISGAAV